MVIGAYLILVILAAVFMFIASFPGIFKNPPSVQWMCLSFLMLILTLVIK